MNDRTCPHCGLASRAARPRIVYRHAKNVQIGDIVVIDKREPEAVEGWSIRGGDVLLGTASGHWAMPPTHRVGVVRS